MLAGHTDGDGEVMVVGRPPSPSQARCRPRRCAFGRAVGEATFLPALRGQRIGAIDMGLAPGVLPGRVSLEAGRGYRRVGLGAGLVRPRTAGIRASMAGGDSGTKAG